MVRLGLASYRDRVAIRTAEVRGITALLHRAQAASTAPLAPVEATLAAMRDRHGDATVHGLLPGLCLPASSAVPSKPRGWTPATRIVDGTRLGPLLAAAAHRWDAPLHVAAALAWKAYTYWVALPAVLGYASAHRVPLLSADDVLIRFHDHQPFLTVALRARTRVAVLLSDPIGMTDAPTVRVVRSEAALLAAFRKALFDRHLDPLLEQIRSTVHIGRRTLLGSVASAVSYGVARAAHVLPGPPVKVAGDLLDALGLADLVDLREDASGGMGVNRHTCCLAFTKPDLKICSGCPVPRSWA
jgi:hypothetical protein